MQSKLTPFEAALLTDLAANKQSWLESARLALTGGSFEWSEHPDKWRAIAAASSSTDSRVALLAVIEELLSGISHSFLATLDGATHLAETTMLEVRGDNAVPFKRYLHEFWPEYRSEA